MDTTRSMAVCTFLEEYDLSGKQVVPFTAYGENVFGRSLTTIEDLAEGASISDGLAIQEHRMDDLSDQVSGWLQELGLLR